MKLSLKKDLGPLRADAIAAVDAQAGEVRARFITVTPGQDMVYLEKRQEAERYVADQSTSEAELPHLAREASTNGVSIMDVAVEILTLAQQWKTVSSAIEAARLGAKAAIERATTPAEITAAMPDWRPFQP